MVCKFLLIDFFFPCDISFLYCTCSSIFVRQGKGIGIALKVIFIQDCFRGLVRRMRVPRAAVAVQRSHGEGWHRDRAEWLETAVPPGSFSAEANLPCSCTLEKTPCVPAADSEAEHS